MKRTIWGLALALGCAGVDGASDGEGALGEEGTEAELGVLQQPLLGVPGIPGLPDAYGTDTVHNRCWTDGGSLRWEGGWCKAPSTRSGWTVYVPSTNSTKGCTNSDVRAAIKDAALIWAARLNVEGWDVTVSTAAEVAGDKKFAIKCDTSIKKDADGTLLYGGTTLPADCVNQDTENCLETPYGVLLIYKDLTDIRVFVTNIGSTDYELIRNITAHELGHAFGLGHDTAAETCLMGPLGDEACPNPFTTLQRPTTFELDMLLEYVPFPVFL